MPTDSRHLQTVRKVLREYADRGVFSSFKEEHVRAGLTRFEFGWIHNRAYQIDFNEKTATLTVRDCFPHIPARSQLDGGIRDFLKARSDKSLPAHRRIDPGRAKVGSINRKGSVSLTIKAERNQFTYAARTAVNLLHETLYMLDQYFTEYLYEHFGLPEE